MNNNKHHSPLTNRIHKLESRVTSLENWKSRTRETLINLSRSNSTETIITTTMTDNNEQQQQLVSATATVAVAVALLDSNETSVYPLLTKWLHEPTHRILHWQKTHALSNDLRQLVFDRNEKALKKYASPLTVEDSQIGLHEAAEKLSDALFFLFKFFSTPLATLRKVDRNELLKNKTLVNDLHNVLGVLLKEIK